MEVVLHSVCDLHCGSHFMQLWNTEIKVVAYFWGAVADPCREHHGQFLF